MPIQPTMSTMLGSLETFIQENCRKNIDLKNLSYQIASLEYHDRKKQQESITQEILTLNRGPPAQKTNIKHQRNGTICNVKFFKDMCLAKQQNEITTKNLSYQIVSLESDHGALKNRERRRCVASGTHSERGDMENLCFDLMETA